MRKDVLVVGGGPAGLASALYAARAGLSVTVLEPRADAVDKACGEGLMPGGLSLLADLGIDPRGRELLGIRYVDGLRAATADFASGAGRGVRRTTLHAALGARVAATGIEVLHVAARDLSQDDDGVQVRTVIDRCHVGPTLHGRYLLAADGLHSPVRKTLGLDASSRGPRRYGLRQHYGIPAWSAHVEVHWGRHGEAYVTPVAEDLVGVAVLSARRLPFEQHLRDFPVLTEHLRAGEAVTDVRGAGPFRQRSRRRVAGRVLLVGDASGYVDALTGEGVALGLAQARAAVESVAAGRPQSYERTWRQVTRRYTLMTTALVQGTRAAPLRRAVVPAAAALPMAFAAAVHQLGRPA